MNPGLVLGAVIVLTAVLAIAVGAAMWSYVRRPWRVSCPRDGRDARIQVDRTSAVRAEVVGGERWVARCSLWPVLSCGESCLDTPAATRHVVQPGEPRATLPGHQTILVPLDGTRASEAVLPTARALARGRGARVRLLRVVPHVEAVHDGDDERVISYIDQEAASAEAMARDYLGRVQQGFGGFQVDTVVRFGDPADEILRESDASDVALIAMAARRRGWLRRSVTARVAKAAWVPVVRTGYGATA